MRGYRLSPRAELTLEDVISWMIEHFGVGQAKVYKDQLISRLAALAANELPHGLSCNGLLAGQRDVVDLEYYRKSRHYIICRSTIDDIFVLDFVHGSRDLAAILSAYGSGQHRARNGIRDMHQSLMASRLTVMPRLARRSSTSPRLRLNLQ